VITWAGYLAWRRRHMHSEEYIRAFWAGVEP